MANPFDTAVPAQQGANPFDAAQPAAQPAGGMLDKLGIGADAWKNLAKNLYEGFKQPGYSAEQALQHVGHALGLQSDKGFQQFQQDQQARQATWDAQAGKTWGGGLVQTVGAMAGVAPALAAAPAALAAVPAVGAAATMAQPTREDGGNYASQRAIGGVQGATAAMAVPVVGKIIGAIGSKAASVLAGTSLGNRLGIPTELNPKYAGTPAPLQAQTDAVEAGQSPPPNSPSAPQISKQLDQAGITTHTVGDVTGDPVVRAQENALARNNPAMMDLRLKQNQQAAAYGQKVVGDLRQAVDEAGWQNISDVQAAADAGGKRSGQAQAILTAAQNSGDDWKAIAQSSGNLKLFLNKLASDGKFDTAQAAADPLGKVPTPALSKTIAGSVSSLEGNSAAPESAKSFLGKIQEGLTPGQGPSRTVSVQDGTPAGNIPHPMNPNDPYGVNSNQALAPKTAQIPGSYIAPTQDTTFGGLRQLRSSINTRIADIQQGTVSASSEELPHLARVSAAIEKDLGNFAQAHPEVGKLYQDASDFYKVNVVPYKEAAFGKALADTDPLKAANLFAGKNTAQQQRFFGLLDPKGQAAVRAGLVEDALDAGEKTQRGAMGQTFGAANAAGKLEQLQRNGTMSVAFPGGEDNWAASGLAKILRTVDRSDNVGFTPPTGVTGQSIGAKAEGNTTVIGAIGKAYDWLNKDRLMNMYSDPKGRALLIRASDLTTGSPAMKNLIDNQLPKVAGAMAPNQQ